MYNTFKTTISSYFKISMTIFIENKNYIQGMFSSNKSKMSNTLIEKHEHRAPNSTKLNQANSSEIFNLDNIDNEILVK